MQDPWAIINAECERLEASGCLEPGAWIADIWRSAAGDAALIDFDDGSCHTLRLYSSKETSHAGWIEVTY